MNAFSSQPHSPDRETSQCWTSWDHRSGSWSAVSRAAGSSPCSRPRRARGHGTTAPPPGRNRDLHRAGGRDPRQGRPRAALCRSRARGRTSPRAGAHLHRGQRDGTGLPLPPFRQPRGGTFSCTSDPAGTPAVALPAGGYVLAAQQHTDAIIAALLASRGRPAETAALQQHLDDAHAVARAAVSAVKGPAALPAAATAVMEELDVRPGPGAAAKKRSAISADRPRRPGKRAMAAVRRARGRRARPGWVATPSRCLSSRATPPAGQYSRAGTPRSSPACPPRNQERQARCEAAGVRRRGHPVA